MADGPLPPARSARRTSKPVLHKRYRRLTAVVTVVALLGFGGLAAAFFFGRGDERRERTEDVLAEIAGFVQEYRQRTGALPDDLAALVGLETCYDGGVCPRDAYGGVIQYRVVDDETAEFRLRSSGPDKVAPTDDDLVWPPGSEWDARP